MVSLLNFYILLKISVKLHFTDTIRRYIVATTTIWSGASYIFSKGAVKILTKPEIEAAEKKKAEGAAAKQIEPEKKR